MEPSLASELQLRKRFVKGYTTLSEHARLNVCENSKVASPDSNSSLSRPEWIQKIFHRQRPAPRYLANC